MKDEKGTMTRVANQLFSRRKWLKFMTTASAASGVLGASEMFASTASLERDQQLNGASVDANTKGTRIYNIRDFGAKGDGVTLDTAALQAAIDACNRDQGGTVLVPAGVFVIGTVEIKSNVTLH